MHKITLFITEIISSLSLIHINPETASELANIAIIVAVRVAFYFFEKKFPAIKKIVSLKNKKQ